MAGSPATEPDEFTAGVVVVVGLATTPATVVGEATTVEVVETTDVDVVATTPPPDSSSDLKLAPVAWSVAAKYNFDPMTP